MRRPLLVLLACLLTAAAACSSGDDGATSSTVPGSSGSTTTTAAGATPEATASIPNPGGPLDATSTSVSADALVRAERVTYASDGQTVPALVSMPVLTAAPHACVVVVHGLGGSKDDSRATWGAFALAGIGTIAIDARLHGERAAGDLVDEVTSPEAFGEMLRGTAVDARRAYDYLETRPECDPARLGYLGYSMGAIIGSLVAGSDPRVQAPVLFAGGGDWRTILETSDNEVLVEMRKEPGGIDAAVAVLDPLDPVRFAPGIAPRALFMLNGDADKTIPPAAAQALFDSAGEPKRIEWWKGGHGPEGLEAIRVLGLVTEWFGARL